MSFKKAVLPSAKEEKKWLCETYGRDFGAALDKWLRQIFRYAPDDPKKLLLIPLEDVLDEEKQPWSYVWRKLKDQTAIDRLRSLLAFIRSAKPPYELYAVHARFLTQGTFWVNVIAVVEVDRVEKKVVLTYLHWYGDA